ncbi:hypothetical protein RhiirA1_473117 [Rhizophagus irregularis]|nr:hypothetical protein RhiirA1_473117 [Rhizophagus irregularis]
MAALEVETNVISTSSGRTLQFVAISTICSVGDNIIQQVTLPKLRINVKFLQGDDLEEFANQ